MKQYLLRLLFFAKSLTEELGDINSKKCLYSIFIAGRTGTFMSSLQTQILRPIQDYGYSVNDDIIGNLIVRLHEGEETLRIFEVWVPISSE